MPFYIEVTSHQRKCCNCHLLIADGDKCLTLRHGSGGYSVVRNLCARCFHSLEKILDTPRVSTTEEGEDSEGEQMIQRQLDSY
jgi:hypothetical protein